MENILGNKKTALSAVDLRGAHWAPRLLANRSLLRMSPNILNRITHRASTSRSAVVVELLLATTDTLAMRGQLFLLFLLPPRSFLQVASFNPGDAAVQRPLPYLTRHFFLPSENKPKLPTQLLIVKQKRPAFAGPSCLSIELFQFDSCTGSFKFLLQFISVCF